MLWTENFDGTTNELRALEQCQLAPLIAAAIIGAAGMGASSAASSISAGKAAKKQNQLNERELALRESELDPFRHQLNQAGALSDLDMLELANLSPVSVQAPPGMESFMPQFSGGFSYSPSPELRAAAGELKNSVLAGQTAPAMNTPSSYGRTGAIPILTRLARTNPQALENYMAPRRPVGVRAMPTTRRAMPRPMPGGRGRI